jgi:D-arabinose 1-dehydrogenase-like Zn-dependent alcohol dehydrogenase
MRSIADSGVDGLIDAAVLGRDCLDAVRDGGRIAHLRRVEYPSERRITSQFVSVLSDVGIPERLEAVLDTCGRGALEPPRTMPIQPSQAAEAHRLMERGGVPGRLQLRFGEGREPQSTS